MTRGPVRYPGRDGERLQWAELDGSRLSHRADDAAAGTLGQSRWPIDVGSVVYTDHAHYMLFLFDTQDDSVLAAPRPAEAF